MTYCAKCGFPLLNDEEKCSNCGSNEKFDPNEGYDPFAKIQTRAIVPPYVKKVEWDNREAEYTPWVIGHGDIKQLENDVLDALWGEFAKPDGDFSEFIEFLGRRGYIVFHANVAGVWSPKEL